jgi:hypothetical protein
MAETEVERNVAQARFSSRMTKARSSRTICLMDVIVTALEGVVDADFAGNHDALTGGRG